MKTINLDLSEQDGNALCLIGAFRRQARKEGWNKQEIDKVADECMKGDYDHLLQILIPICEPKDE